MAVARPPLPPSPFEELPPAPPMALALDWTVLEPVRLSETLALPPRPPVALEAYPPAPPDALVVASIAPPAGLLVVRREEALPPRPGVPPSPSPPLPPMAVSPS